MRITPNPEGVGARVEGVDLSRPLSDDDFRAILRALGERGVLCFPNQSLDAAQLSAFGSRFGQLEHNVANSFHAPGHPEVMVLSNMKEGGKPVGLNDARGRPGARKAASRPNLCLRCRRRLGFPARRP